MINTNNDSINIGDLIFIKRKNRKDKYEVGDIISFIKNDEVITHRIIKKNKDLYKTKGDNNKLSDKFNVIESEIIGKLIGKIRVNKIIVKNIPLRLFEFEIFTILFIIKYFLIDGVKKWK
jgi:signal peptidase I